VLKVVQALRSRLETLESLESSRSIHSKRHSQYPELVQLKYNQIESPMGDEMVQECRGLILDESHDYQVVAWPFKKFFNYGEGHAPSIDWEGAGVQEKLDGSLIILYWYKDAWNVATSGTPDALGEVNGCDFTFEDLFWRVFKEKGYTVPDECYRPLTFMFELMTPFNRVVVRHPKNELKLIGLRNRNYGQEFFPTPEYGYDRVKMFDLSSMDDVLGTFKSMDPLNQEGYVVVSKTFDRVKVKHPGYVALHHMIDNMTPKGILTIIMSGEYDEVLNAFPEWRGEFDRIQAGYNRVRWDLEERYNTFKGIQSQKDFAFAVKDTPGSGVLFGLRSGKIKTVLEGLSQMPVKNVLDLIRLNEPQPERVDTMTSIGGVDDMVVFDRSRDSSSGVGECD